MTSIIPASQAIPSVRRLLHDATHQLHVQLNHQPLLAGLTQPGYSLARYRKVLRAYCYLYQELEQRIDRFLARQPGVFEYEDRRKLLWLQQDLAFLSEQPVSAAQTPVAVALPDIQRIGQLIGVLYVIEGSTLGGQLISRHLAQHHDLGPGQGADFFNGYADRSASMWQAFITFADSILDDPAECQAAQESARQTFQSFMQVLDHFG